MKKSGTEWEKIQVWKSIESINVHKLIFLFEEFETMPITLAIAVFNPSDTKDLVNVEIPKSSQLQTCHRVRVC